MGLGSGIRKKTIPDPGSRIRNTGSCDRSGGMASSTPGSGAGAGASGPTRELSIHDFSSFFLFLGIIFGWKPDTLISCWNKSYWSCDLRGRDGLLHPGVGGTTGPLVLPETCLNMIILLFFLFWWSFWDESRTLWLVVEIKAIDHVTSGGGMASSTPGSGMRGRRLSSSSLDGSLFPIYEDPGDGNESFPLFSDLESMAGSEVSCAFTRVADPHSFHPDQDPDPAF